MSDEAAQPDDELTQAIRNAILAGAAEGAESTARRIAAAASTGLDEIKAVLQTLAAGTVQPVTISGSASLSSMAVAGRVHTAAAALTVPVTMGAAVSGAASAGLIVHVTMGVGAADVAAAADELRVIGQPDVENLAGPLPAGWTKQELVLNSLFLVAVAYWLLPPAEQQYLANMAILVAAVAAVAALLK
jgi:hypothetical protein